jgi:spore maturation protein CgeB
VSPAAEPLDIAIFGLSITSAWGNGHATTYRALTRALTERGHKVRFFERDMPWYVQHRDLPNPTCARTQLYSSIPELDERFGGELDADLVIIGSYVPEAVRLCEWLLPRVSGMTAFYDIDTPVTVAHLDRGDCQYLTPDLIPHFDVYLSFAGGPVLERLRAHYGARRPRPLYCSVDSREYFPTRSAKRYDLGYLGTYSPDRQPALERLLFAPAQCWRQGRFSVAGAQYPDSIEWPANVAHAEHLPPDAHRGYYNSQRFTLSVTRADMIANGYSPSVRLFEAAACGVPIITDEWPGMADFFTPGTEIFVARNTADVLYLLRELEPGEAIRVGAKARERVMRMHTAAHRAIELESYIREGREGQTNDSQVGRPRIQSAWSDGVSAKVQTVI